MNHLIVFLLLFTNCASAQYKNNIWVFGDSAGIDFRVPTMPVTFSSSMDERGSCISIADSNNNLIFYGATKSSSPGNTAYLWDKNNNEMQNGDSLVGAGWYHEMVIIPYPTTTDSFYVFSIGVTSAFHAGLYYSIVDMTQNGGLGAVVSKNNQLSSLFALDALAAVKHGNGSDWWLIFKPEGYQNGANNNYYVYYVSANGIFPTPVQSIGGMVTTNLGNMVFSKDGNKLLTTDVRNLIQLMDFDRCTGLLSNAVVIEQEDLNQAGAHFGSCISPNRRFIYATHIPYFVTDTVLYLYQYDMNAPNIAASRDTIFVTYTPNLIANLRLAPDGNVYMTTWYNCNSYCFPYPDSVYNNINMNLSVVNSPDSLGTACNFTPYSFYLGGKRSYAGLPNNPDYEMGPLLGSGCDTITAIENGALIIKNANLQIFYHRSWQVAFINAANLKGKNFVLSVYDVLGKEVFKEEGVLTSAYFTKDINCTAFANEMYVVNLQTEKENISSKFVK